MRPDAAIGPASNSSKPEGLRGYPASRLSEAAAFFAATVSPAAEWASGMDCLARFFRDLSASDIAQIQRKREVGIRLDGWNFYLTRRVPEPEKPRQPPRFGLVAVHRKRIIAATTRMGDMIRAPAEAAPFHVSTTSKPAACAVRWSAADTPAAATRGNARQPRLRRWCPSDATAARCPPTVMAKRSPIRPRALTCSRSSELSTYRTVRRRPVPRPAHARVRAPCVIRSAKSRCSKSPMRGNRNSKCGANQSNSKG